MRHANTAGFRPAPATMLPINAVILHKQDQLLKSLPTRIQGAQTAGGSTGRFRNHSKLTGVTRNLRLDFIRCRIRRAKESRPRERHGEAGTEGRTLVEHLDPGEQMAQIREHLAALEDGTGPDAINV